MPTISYEDLLPEVIPMAPEAPDFLLIRYIRAAVIELAERASVYQKDLDPISSVATQFEYDFDVPAGTVVHRIQWATFEGRDLEPLSPSLVEQRYEKWRGDNVEDTSSTPEVFVQQGQTSFWLVPKPSKTVVDGIRVRAVLKPTHTSTACDATVMNDYRDTIINGTLFRALRTPGHAFTNISGAQVYGSLFNQQVIEAERKARYGDQSVVRTVKYGGLKSGRKDRKYSGRGMHGAHVFRY